MISRSGFAASIRRHAAAVLVAFVAGGASPSAAPAKEDAQYVLGPEARGPIQAALDRMKPALALADGSIEHDHVLVRLCTRAEPAEQCFRLHLEHPRSGCGAARWGQFCARFPDGEPPPPMVAVIADALQGTNDVALWTQLERPVGSGSEAVSARALGIALALLLTPLATTYLIGSLWRRHAGPRQGIAFTLGAIVVPMSLALALDTQFVLIGFWDALLVGLLSGAGLLLAAHRSRPDWKALSVFLASSVGSLLIAEMACRAFLPPPPSFRSERGPTLLMSTAVQQMAPFSMACASIYGNQPPPAAFSPVYPASWQPRAGVRWHVLHLGDSMVQGSRADGRFTDDLNRLEPDVEHVNAAIGGTGPDVYLAILRRFLRRGELDAVLLHLTPNDYDDVDGSYYPCSAWQPLLVYGPSGTRLRFAEARPFDKGTQRLRWHQSPPPYALRACARVSNLAAYLAAAIVDTQQRLAARSAGRNDADQRAHFAAIMRDVVDELRAHDVPLVVNVFRDRAAVERNRLPEHPPEDTMGRITEALGVVVLDTWEPLVAAVGSGARPFTNEAGPTDSHFNADGHALIAQWLHRELPGAIERARVSTRTD